MLAPVSVTTTIFEFAFTDNAILPPDMGIFTLLVPFAILGCVPEVIPVKNAPLPKI